MRCDFHCHSHFSDGAHDPEYLLQRAIARGISHFAITDHDCVDAYHRLVDQIPALQLTLIPGLEISSLHGKQEIHVIGLGVDPEHSALVALMHEQQEKRRDRIRAIDQLLVKHGVSGLQEYMDALPSHAPGRTQVADFLVQQGLCRDRSRAFQGYLGRSGRCYVAPTWCPITRATEVIADAGGIAVLAHPHRYATTTSGLRRLFREFHAAGGEGVEIACTNMDRSMLEKLSRLALETGLYASVGSDFHSAAATWTDIGKLPELPEAIKKNAIWAHPRWHF